MKNLIRLKKSHSVRPMRLEVLIVAVAAVVVLAAGIVAEEGNAAPAVKADKASHRLENPKFKHPKLKTVSG